MYLFLLQRSSMCAFFFNILPIFYISFMHMTGEMSNLIRKKRFDSLANGRTRIFLFPVHLHLLRIISCSLGIYQSHTNLQNKFVCLYIMYLRLYQLRYINSLFTNKYLTKCTQFHEGKNILLKLLYDITNKIAMTVRTFQIRQDLYVVL